MELKSGTTLSTDTAHSGSKSMKMIVTGIGGNESMGGLLGYWNQYTSYYPGWYYIGSGSKTLYYRWWMKIMPGFKWASHGGGKVKISRAIVHPSDEGYTGYMWQDGFNIAECNLTGGSGCLNTDGSQNGSDSGIKLNYDVASKDDGNWHEYIIRVKPNTCSSCMDAELQLWVDGTSQGTLSGWKLSSWTNQDFNEAWGSWASHWYWQMNGTTGDGGTIYIDDISTDDTYNSIYSGGSDTTPPVRSGGLPSGEQVYGTTQVTMQVTTDENATCKYGSSSGVAYASMSNTFSTTGGTSHSTTISGLSNGGSYTRYVRCIDGSSNANTSDYSISWTVASSPSAQDCPSNWKSLHPTWIYCDDFETDKSNLWVDSNYYGSRMVRSAGNGYSGTYSMRATFPFAPSSASNGGDFMVAFGASPVSPTVDAADTTKYRELYWRAYIKTQAGWQPGTGQKLTRATSFHNSSWAQSMIAHWWGSSASPENTLQVDPAGGVCRGGVYPAGSPSCTNNTVITTGWNDFDNLYWLGGVAGTATVLGTASANTWQCLEGYVKLNDSGQTNGVQTFWVDGVQDATKTGLNFVGTYSTYGINIFRVENYANSGTTNAQYRDWDNLVLSSERIGCTVGGSDSTPPSVTIVTADPSTISADSLTATGTASDGTGVSGCKWRMGSAPDASNGTACTGTTSFSCSTSGYSEGANTLYVGCYDAAGNYGSDSIVVNRDSTAPTTPTDLDARSSSTSTVDLSWQPSTDAVGVTSYRVDYCSGYNCSSWATLGTSATNSYTHTGITPAANPTIYRYRVYALDAANNLSGAATSIHFNAQPTIPAFPGAEGGGAYSKGGRGGTVYHVTSLLGDTSAGTLRACVNATGPRTCVFDVGGTIELTSNVNVSGPYITIAGDTAPGGGIAISGKNSTSVTFTVRTHNVIVRGIRFRKGYNAGTPDQDGDSSNVTSASATSGPVGPIIFDHVSSSWTQDENAEVWSLTTRAPKDVTYQWAMFYEPFLDHPTNYITGAYDQATANKMTGIDVHHSMFSQSGWRNPLIKNKQFRLINNLIYNWSRYATMIGGGSDVDVIGNTYKQGSRYATGGGIVNLHEISVFPSGNSTTPTGNPTIYAVGNKGWNNTNPLADNWSTNMVWEVDQENGTDMNSLSTSYRRLTPLTALPFPITTQDAATAETIVLAGAGASRRLDCSGNWVSIRDSQDARIVSEYTNNTGALVLLSSETEVGGYPTLAAGTACTDTDGDGMPDTWETANGLNASSASDGPTLHASGYSNLEMYLAGSSSETTPVLSNLLPTSNLARTATSATLQATTDQTATCRYALGSGTPYAGMTPFSNTASTTHSSNVSIVAGGVYQYCVRCMGTSLVSDESCTRFAVDPNPKKRVRH